MDGWAPCRPALPHLPIPCCLCSSPALPTSTPSPNPTTEYTSSLSDFLDAASLRNLAAVRSLRQLALAVHSMEDAFCSAEK